ncbi:MAG TPA: hypothetical protein VEQ61_07045, partial [Thermoleophilaceae bacterium]|nr:hypothetical protein [Thermoleophilaceae bacterium]
KQLNEPQTDLPALAWVACCAGLATAAGRRPALLVPALLAAGLAVGTKPSTGPMALAAVGIGAYLAREHLRPLAGWLGLGIAGAFAVGSVWYLRNIFEHGSPLWPFMRGPWGDVQPRFLGLLEVSFLERPSATLEGRVGEYVERLGGAGLVVLGALLALVAGLLGLRSGDRVRRQLVVSGGLAALGVLIWSTAWGTGLPESQELKFAAGFSLSALRYLLPAMGAAAVTVAIASGAGRRAAVAATVCLASAVAVNLVLDARLGEPWTPPLWVPAVGALAGTAVLGASLVVQRLLHGRRARVPRLGGVSTASVAAALMTGALLSLAANGFLERYSKRPNTTAYGPELVSWFLAQPFFEQDDLTIAIASRGVVAQLAGDHFTNRLVLVPQRASCAEVERLARRMPVVVTPEVFARGFLGLESYTAPGCLARHTPVLDRDPFFVYRLPQRVASSP